VIELSGVIMDSRKMIKQLEKFDEDADIKGVVLRINSPGGAVAPSQEIYQAVRAFKKPLVASMGSVAASGGYYIAVGAKKVYANPGTITGSIGVIMEFANLSKLYEWAKIQRYAIKTGKFKDAGAEYREMQPEERALLQGMVDDVLGQFKRAVSEGRKLKGDELNPIADGRVFSGAQAKQLKLVDELGTLQDAIDDVAKQAKLTGKPRVVYQEKRKRRLLDLLLDDQPSDSESESSAAPTGALGALFGRIGATLEGRAESLLPSLDSSLALAPGIYWLWKGAH
jgi:protease-4